MLTAGSATFNVGNVPFAGASMALTRRAGAVIPVSTYRAALNAMPADPALYHVTDRTDVRLGDIVRNSTELQAPLVDVRPDWISRLVLTNSGKIGRAHV